MSSQAIDIRATFVGPMQFDVTSATGHTIALDVPEGDGGSNQGPTPMELLLMALAGCTGMDVISISEEKAPGRHRLRDPHQWNTRREASPSLRGGDCRAHCYRSPCRSAGSETSGGAFGYHVLQRQQDHREDGTYHHQLPGAGSQLEVDIVDNVHYLLDRAAPLAGAGCRTTLEKIMPGMSDLPEAPRTFGFDTLAIHAGQRPDPYTGASALPIYQTSAFVFEDTESAAAYFNLQEYGNIYSRIMNPTVAAFEERIASLEGGAGAVAFGSGLAAQAAVFFTLLQAGDHVVASQAIYGGTIAQFKNTLSKLGVEFTFVRSRRQGGLGGRGSSDSTKAFFAETIGNPGGNILDLALVAEIAAAHRLPLIVDNTFATPYLCRPIRVGSRHRRSLRHEVHRRPRYQHRRSGGGLGQIQLVEWSLPQRRRSLARVSWAPVS